MATKTNRKRPARKAAKPRPKALRPDARPEAPDSHTHFVYATTVGPTGRRVDELSVLRVSRVIACVRFIASTLAGLDWSVYRILDNAGQEYDPRHPVDWLLDWQPNPEMNAFTFRELQLLNCLLWGNSYAEIERNFLNGVVALWPIHPQRVTLERDRAGRLVYRVQNPTGDDTFLDPADVFHVRWMSPDGLLGYNLTRLAAETLGLTMAASDFANTNFGAAIPAGVLTTPQVLGKDAAERVETSWQNAHGGRNSRRKVPVLEADLKFAPIHNQPVAAQMNESREFQVEEIANLYGVPLSEITGIRNPTAASIEQQARQKMTCLRPWADRLEREADVKLFGPKQRGNFCTHHDFSMLLRGDTQSFGDFLSKMADRGVYSPNEVRLKLHENPIPAGEGGDKRLWPANFVTLDKAGETPTTGGAASGDSPGAGTDNAPKAKGRNGNTMSGAAWDGLAGVFADAAGRVLRKEEGRFRQALPKLAGRPDRFPGWLAALTAEQRRYARDQAEVPARAAAAGVAGEPDAERRVGRLRAALDRWAEDHAAGLGRRCERAFNSGSPADPAGLWERDAAEVARDLAARVRVALGGGE